MFLALLYISPLLYLFTLPLGLHILALVEEISMLIHTFDPYNLRIPNLWISACKRPPLAIAASLNPVILW